MNYSVLITCEHATNQVPAKIRQHIQAKKNTHFAFDIGAKSIANKISRKLNAPVFLGDVSRLLTDLNRSPSHKKRWGELSSLYSAAELSFIEKKYYLSYRENVFKKCDKLKGTILHFSIHSFTPELNGEVRNADLGLLFDPGRKDELRIAKAIQRFVNAKMSEVRVRRNYPYLGKTDGFVSCLRKRYSSEKYIGIEIEFNQGTAIKNNKLHNCLIDFIHEIL